MVEDDALGAFLVVLQHKNHASPEDLAPRPRRRDQQLACGVIHAHFAILAQVGPM
jgi:hypothetical protein